MWWPCSSLAALSVTVAYLAGTLVYCTTAVQANTEPELLRMQMMYTSARDTSDCTVQCKSSKRRPVCGTDGKTYLSKCDVRRAAKCDKKQVKVKSRGRCSGEARRASSCPEERQQALRDQQRDPSASVYVPACRLDGTFAEKQCHDAAEYCWCVTPDGRPIPGTSVQGTDAQCGHRSGSSSKGCTKADRSAFNINLIKLFSAEFERIPQSQRPSPAGAVKDESLRDTPEKRIIEWKFGVLDKDKDEKLRRTEIRSLKKMIKKLVKPKTCAKTFEDYCDIDKDKKIEPSEWSICLGVDINNEHPTTPSTVARRGPGGLRGVTLPRGGGSTTWAGRPPLQPSPERRQTDTPETQSDLPAPQGCKEERSQALFEFARDPQNDIFVPECTDSGTFKQEQCHTSTGYCWCVDQQSGTPIPGTSTHEITPDCSVLRHRPFKGCPYQEKRVFLTGLLDQLTKSMAEYASNHSNSEIFLSDEDQTLEERAARWKLRMMDNNKNTKLERKEVKPFKDEIKRSQKLRKCGRNFLRYCDADNDHVISMEEWLDCVGLNEPDRNLPDRPNRRGQNPFTNILKSYSDPV